MGVAHWALEIYTTPSIPFLLRRFYTHHEIPTHSVFLATVATAAVAFAQNPVTTDSPFQVRYASNLTAGDSVINITNSGANGAQLNGPGLGPASGNICVNVYAFSPDEQEVSCCSCLVTPPNGLVSLSVVNDLTSNTLTGVRPSSVVVKLISTLAGGTGSGTSCTNSAATEGTLATGLLAWGTTIHAAVGGGFATTETAFRPATLSAAEWAAVPADAPEYHRQRQHFWYLQVLPRGRFGWCQTVNVRKRSHSLTG